MSLAHRWQARIRRWRRAAAARSVLADARAHVCRTEQLLGHAQWLYECWPDARFVLSRPSRRRVVLEIVYEGEARPLLLHRCKVNHLYRLARYVLAVRESRVVNPVVMDTRKALPAELRTAQPPTP